MANKTTTCTFHDLIQEYGLSGEVNDEGMELYEPFLTYRQKGWALSDGGEGDASNDKTVGFEIVIKKGEEFLYQSEFKGLEIDDELNRLSLIYGFSKPINTFYEDDEI